MRHSPNTLLDALLHCLKVGGTLCFEHSQHLHIMIPPDNVFSLFTCPSLWPLTFPNIYFHWSQLFPWRESQWAHIQPISHSEPLHHLSNKLEIMTYHCCNKSQCRDWSIEEQIDCWVRTKVPFLTLRSPPLQFNELGENQVLPRLGLITSHHLSCPSEQYD